MQRFLTLAEGFLKEEWSFRKKNPSVNKSIPASSLVFIILFSLLFFHFPSLFFFLIRFWILCEQFGISQTFLFLRLLRYIIPELRSYENTDGEILLEISQTFFLSNSWHEYLYSMWKKIVLSKEKLICSVLWKLVLSVLLCSCTSLSLNICVILVIQVSVILLWCNFWTCSCFSPTTLELFSNNSWHLMKEWRWKKFYVNV